MKKAFIVIVLIVMPLSIYIFFATAAHTFSYLPTLTKNVEETQDFSPLNKESDIQFKNHYTVLCFFGNNLKKMEGYAFNLNDQIYRKEYIYKGFQMLVVAENGQETAAKELKKKLNSFSGVDVFKWKFGFGDASSIQTLFNSLKSDLQLDKDLSTPYVFIIDPEGNLRGRKLEDHKKDMVETGYNSRSITALKKDLTDDLKVLMAEYKLKEKAKERDFTKYGKEN